MRANSIPAAARCPRRHGIISKIAALLLLHLALPARAELQFDIFPGFDGYVPASSWFPVTCEVFNDGPPFNAFIEVTSSLGRSGQRILVPIELPTNTRKRVTIPLYEGAGGYSGWNFRLADSRDRTRAEQTNIRPRHQIPADSRLVAAVARVPAGMPTLPEVSTQRTESQPAVARVQPNQFPDNPIALEGLAAVYLNSERALDLKAPQSAALLAWIHSGGHLIVSVEQSSDVNATPWLRDLLPCTVGAVTTVVPSEVFHGWLPNSKNVTAPVTNLVIPLTNPAITNAGTGAKAKRRPPRPQPAQQIVPLPYLAADEKFAEAEMPIALTSKREGETLLGVDNLALIIQARRQRGTVTVLTFSPEREPFLSWRHKPWFWMKLTRMPEELWTRRDFNRIYGTGFDSIFGAAIESRQAGKMPFGGLVLLLIGYLLVIGPGDRWLLKRLNRQMLTWITFPFYVAAFSGLVYFIGYKLRAGETEWNELQVVDVIPRGGESAHLRGRTYGSLYSAGNRSYRLRDEAAATFSAVRGEIAGVGGGAFSGLEGKVVRDGNHFIADISVPVWTSQLFINDWTRSAKVPVGFVVRPVQGGHEVEIDNRLDRALTHVTAVIDQRVYTLGDVPAKQKKTFTAAGGGSVLASAASQYAGEFQAAVQYRQNAFGRTQPANVDPAHAVLAASFAKLAREEVSNYGMRLLPDAGLDLTASATRGDAILLATAENHGPAAAMNQFPARRSSRTTIYRLTTKPNGP